MTIFVPMDSLFWSEAFDPKVRMDKRAGFFVVGFVSNQKLVIKT